MVARLVVEPPGNGRGPQPLAGRDPQCHSGRTDDTQQHSRDALTTQADVQASPRYLLTVCENEQCADLLRQIGKEAVSVQMPKWMDSLPLQTGEDHGYVLLVDRVGRLAGDLAARGIACHVTTTPTPYRWPSEYLEARAAVAGYAVDSADMLELWRLIEDRAHLVDIAPTGHPDLAMRPKLPQVLDWGDVVEIPSPEWIIDALLARETIALLVGAPVSGKSLLAIDWCMRMVHGMDWRGRAIRPGSVLYLAGEGFGGLGGRLRAWRAANPGAAANGKYLVVANGVPVLSTPAGRAELVAMIDELVRTRGHAPDVIVVDTLSQSFGDGDENDAKTVAPAMRGLSEIRTAYHCSILVIHHLAKAPQGSVQALTLNAVRGSSALTANVDIVLGIAMQDDVRTLKVLKLKDGEPAAPVASTIIGVETGRILPDGKPERCPIMIPAAEQAASSVIDSDRQVLAALRSAGHEGATRAQVVDVTGMRPNTAWDSLARLTAKDGPAVMKKSKPVRYWLAEFAPSSGDDPAKIRPDVPPDQPPAGAGRSDDPGYPGTPVGVPDRITGSSERAEKPKKQKQTKPGKTPSGARAKILANAQFQRAAKWVGAIEGVPGYCEKVSIDAIKSDPRLLAHWKEAGKAALEAAETMLGKLGPTGQELPESPDAETSGEAEDVPVTFRGYVFKDEDGASAANREPWAWCVTEKAEGFPGCWYDSGRGRWEHEALDCLRRRLSEIEKDEPLATVTPVTKGRPPKVIT